jgi:F-box-like
VGIKPTVSPRFLRFTNILSELTIMSFDSLPREILYQIISSQFPTFTDLWNYSLVCRRIGYIARAVMYRSIDLTVDDRGDEDADERTKRKQLQLLRAIASYVY